MGRAELEVVTSMEAATERELVRRARDGDEDAFADLVRRHSAGMHRLVARMLGDDEEAWDVVQMAWVRAWDRLGRYDARWRFSTWVYRIASNLAIDVIRARGSRERAHAAGGLRVVSRPAAPDRDLEEREVERVLLELVRRLPPQQRAAFVMRELEGMETAEVARALGCSPTTVRNHVFHARRALREALARRHPEYLRGMEGR